MSSVCRRIAFAAMMIVRASILEAGPMPGPQVRLTDWLVVKAGAIAPNGGGFRTSSGRGWIRTRTEFGDFDLRLEYRVDEPGSRAAVLVRAWVERLEEQPGSGYRVVVGDAISGKDAVGAVTAFQGHLKALMNEATQTPTAAPAVGDWQALEIRGEGDRLTVSLNGSVINDVQGTEPLAGHVGIEASRGHVEFRNFVLTPLGGLRCEDSTSRAIDAAAVVGNGVASPTLQFSQRPRYTVEAMNHKVTGVVLIEAVVNDDGALGDLCISRPLHPDLDVEAVAAVRRWRFSPGQRDGKPVPVHVKLEISFSLRN